MALEICPPASIWREPVCVCVWVIADARARACGAMCVPRYERTHVEGVRVDLSIKPGNALRNSSWMEARNWAARIFMRNCNFTFRINYSAISYIQVVFCFYLFLSNNQMISFAKQVRTISGTNRKILQFIILHLYFWNNWNISSTAVIPKTYFTVSSEIPTIIPINKKGQFKIVLSIWTPRRSAFKQQIWIPGGNDNLSL